MHGGELIFLFPSYFSAWTSWWSIINPEELTRILSNERSIIIEDKRKMAPLFLPWPHGHHNGFGLRMRSWRKQKRDMKERLQRKGREPEESTGVAGHQRRLESCRGVRLSCPSDGVIIAGGLNWWGKKDLFCLHLHLSSVIISEKNINLEMDKWLENSDHPLSECGVLATELFMESLSPPENLNVLCVHFSRDWDSFLRQKCGNWTHLPSGPIQNVSSSRT